MKRVPPFEPQIWRFSKFLLLFLSVTMTLPSRAQENISIYTDSIQSGWYNWSWNAAINPASTVFVHSGSKSMAVTLTGGWGALYLDHAALDTTPYGNLVFWVHGGNSGKQPLAVIATTGGKSTGAPYNFSPTAGTWQQINVPLSTLKADDQPDFDGIWIQNQSGAVLTIFYIDDMTLVTNGIPAVTNMAATVTVDCQSNRHSISPLIYGVAFASATQLADLNFTLNRSGGNAETRYNWQINAHNRGSDWYFETYGDDGGATAGAVTDSFVQNTKTGGAMPLITIPMIGWSPKLGSGRSSLRSYSVAKYGPQTDTDPWNSDAGNGIGTNTTTQRSWLITTNDPTDANFQSDSTFQQGYVQHLVQKWGASTNGGVRFYLMDNEHSIWHSTHRDVHPTGAKMEEVRDKFFDYAAKVKAADPDAMVLAPEEWGWSGYFYSGYDQQYGVGKAPDRAAHGGMDYLPWLLSQFHQHATNTNQRLLDYFTVHCYPQDASGGSDASSSTQLLRNRSTRQFWDTNYVQEDWINSVVKLIPRMKDWVNQYYPGTKIGITEYNWGAEASIGGATAQADILGIFGREGLDLATRWTTPATNTPVYQAMKLYRNYDGKKSAFGDTSVTATGPNPDSVAAFAAVRSSDSALTLMVINKQLTLSASVAIHLAHFQAAGTAQVWQLTSTNAITRLPDLSFSGSTFTNTVPAQSITLLVIPAQTITPPPSPVLRSATLPGKGTLAFWVTNGLTGYDYVLQSSIDLSNWAAVRTNTFNSSSNVYTLPATESRQFYRLQWRKP
jgi:hypothetical protein